MHTRQEPNTHHGLHAATSSRVSGRDALRDALARVVFAWEAIGEGEVAIAASVLRDLEHDLVVVLVECESEEVA